VTRSEIAARPVLSPRGRRQGRSPVVRGAHRFLLPLLVAVAVLLPGDPGWGAGPVRVLYAGALVNLMEHALVPAVRKAEGLVVYGRPGGSVALAHLIRDRLEAADVFISADPEVNRLLSPSPSRPSAAWFFTLMRTSVVIAYNPRSRFAPLFQEASRGRLPWYRVLEEPGLRLGRTDPALDPKGYRTILVLELAERYYHEPGLTRRILGPPGNAGQIFPEETLLGRLEAGQLDAGFFYLSEAVEQHLPYIPLPDAINLGNPGMAAAYARVAYVDPSGAVHRGSPIVYTVTIPSTARNRDGALRFVLFLYSPAGQALLRAHGFPPMPALVGGDASAVPAELRRLVAGSYTG